MASSDELLIRALLEESQQDYSASPAYAIGQRLSTGSIPLQNRMSPMESILAGALSGLSGGFLQGMAESQAESNQARRSEAIKEIASKEGEERYSLVESDPKLRKFGSLMRLADALNNDSIEYKAPPTRTIHKDGQEIMEELNTKTGEWSEISRDARWEPKTPDVPKPPEDKTFEQEMNLRKEFEGLPVTKSYEISNIGLNALKGAIKDKSATSDLELVRGAIQAIEPGMAVREGEAAAAQSSDSIPGEWKAQIKKALTGESGLSDNVREGLLRIAERRYSAYADQFAKQYDFYKSRAEADKLDPNSFTHIQRPGLAQVADALSSQTAPVGQEPSKYVVGQTAKTKDGATVTWDGKGWRR